MAFFKRLSQHLSKKEIDILRLEDHKAFDNLSLDRQGEIYMILKEVKGNA